LNFVFSVCYEPYGSGVTKISCILCVCACVYLFRAAQWR